MTLQVLDVNVLLAVQRADHPDHPALRGWFDALLERADRFAVPSFVWASFLRLTTHRRIFAVPTPREQAFAFVEAVSAQPTHVRLEPGPRHLVLLRRLCVEAEASADLVPDAALAAVALEHGADVVSLDRDFARFASVTWHRPALAP